MRLPTLLSALLLVPLLSGCLSEAPADAEGLDAAPPDPSGPSGSSGSSGRSGSSGSSGSSSDASGGSIASDVDAIVFAWTGSTAASACVPSGTTSCTGASVPFGEDSWSHAAGRGDRVGVEVNVTWDQRLPGLGDLRVTLYAVASCGDRCYEYRTLATEQGPTPLRLRTDLHALEDGEREVHVVVRDARPTIDDPVLADATHPRAFEAEGTLRLVS